MKAAILRKAGGPLTLEEVEIEGPQSGEVRVRMVASGICHSDYSMVHGVVPCPLPAILGHEGAGIVEEVGPGVERLAVGDHVIAVLTPSCGACGFCSEGKPFLCKEMGKTMNEFTQLDGTVRTRRGGEDIYRMCAIGSFAEQAIIPQGAAIPIDKKYPLEKVCLIGCGVTTGVGAALNTAQVRPESSVAIVGCGGVGLSILQGARIAGATTIIAVDPQQEKRDLAVSLGATHTVDPSSENPVKTVRKMTGGGVHYAFEALGLRETMEQAYGMVRPTGLAVVVGVARFGEEISLKAGTFLAEKHITGSAYGSAVPVRDVPRYLEYYERGELNLDAMITREISLDQINDAFDQMGRAEGARSVIVYR